MQGLKDAVKNGQKGSFTLTEPEKDVSWKSQFKAQNRVTIYKYLQI